MACEQALDDLLAQSRYADARAWVAQHGGMPCRQLEALVDTLQYGRSDARQALGMDRSVELTKATIRSAFR
jgi:hypothetical protein